MKHDWAIILAGGEGKRLASLTRALYGQELPKQFAVLAGDRSLLQRTVERIDPLIPYERMVVVVTARYESVARDQLARYPGVDVAVQPPANLDTGPGLLVGVARVLARDPDALITVFPADHHVDDPDRFLAAVETSRKVSRRGLALVGALADRPETEYGWIVPRKDSRPAASLRRVARFVEKPDAAEAERLHAAGAMWNTFVFSGRVGTMWELSARHMPQHTEHFAAYVAAVDRVNERRVLASIFERMSPCNFSRAVLERATGMHVVAAERTGWSDWGTPKRVFASLQGTNAHARLVSRIAAQVPQPTAATA